MAFGLSPKYSFDFNIKGLTNKHLFITAIESANKLDWKISRIGELGFVAYTSFSLSSYSEEIHVVIDQDNIHLKSKCIGSQLVDWGKNKKNIDTFINTFNSLKDNFSEFDIEYKYSELARLFVNEEEVSLSKSPATKKERREEFFALFKPSKGYFITPLLLYINVAILILMAIFGVNILLPSSESLIQWGANFRPMTSDGQWWRLITSCFLHIGIFHLLMNMYALVYIGLLLEPYLGKLRFITAYLLTGIVSSAASFYWNDLTISAGASGAIFGMYGVFLAMLTTNIIDKATRKTLLLSIGIFVGYNLLNGVKGGIDNAAHIGGLLSGLVLGYLYVVSIKKPQLATLKIATIVFSVLFTIASSFILINNATTTDTGKYYTEMELFVTLEQQALSVFSMPENSTDEEYLYQLKEVGINCWNKNIELIDRVDKYNLDESIHKRNSILKDYCNIRIKSYKTMYKAISENSIMYDSEIENCNKEIEQVLKKLEAIN